jgi:hypothetical protein
MHQLDALGLEVVHQREDTGVLRIEAGVEGRVVERCLLPRALTAE